jgi:EAL domain-containing protein (putative c-di-GMP-specific phosphodiesterase class I)/GGDEF domain-containing protein/CBS domain-containing protein
METVATELKTRFAFPELKRFRHPHHQSVGKNTRMKTDIGDRDDARFLDGVGCEIDYAFQPIVNIHTGTVFGFEALVRGYERLGFDNIPMLFEYAFSREILHRLDLILRKIAVEKFMRLPADGSHHLFFNIDPRLLESGDYTAGRGLSILSDHGLSPSRVCLELTEDEELVHDTNTLGILRRYRMQGYRLAIDDFGAGYSGLRHLYESQPDFVKIDRFFITGMDSDHKRKLFVSNIVNLAHVLGLQVVAEGVESEAELRACREIGCDLAQGYFISRPETDLSKLKSRYDSVAASIRTNRRDRSADFELIMEQIERLPPITTDSPMSSVFERFRRDPQRTFFPVIDERARPVGLILERDIKDYIYSPYGRDLISNRSIGKSLRYFVSRVPVVDVRTEAERILETYTTNSASEGVIITEDGHYIGMLTAARLLRIINEKNLTLAREQNPLTRLPGNVLISGYVATALDDFAWQGVLAYLDFDNFKPFNDAYGFRQGDRAILLFSELMRRELTGENIFLGHIGGDDFFVGMRDVNLDEAADRMRKLIDIFRNDVESFYDAEARKRGYLMGSDREGNEHQYPLMTTSVALVGVQRARVSRNADEFAGFIAEQKKKAKAAPDHLCCAELA